jgi:hypothetical protein
MNQFYGIIYYEYIILREERRVLKGGMENLRSGRGELRVGNLNSGEVSEGTVDDKVKMVNGIVGVVHKGGKL